MKERRTLVTDFSGLKAGDYIELERCLVCNGVHSGLLLRFESRNFDLVNWRCKPGPYWEYSPAGHGQSAAFTADAVAERRIFVLDTGLEDSQQTPTTVSKRKGVRA